MGAAPPASDDDLVDELYAAAQLKVQAHGVGSLNDAERAVYTVRCFEGDTMNGGLHQYFFNSAGDDAALALVGLKAIGAHATATLLEAAIAVFANPPSGDREQRWQQMQAWGPGEMAKLDALSLEVYGYPDQLTPLLAAYCRASSAA